MLTVHAERPRGAFSRQLFLGETLDTERIDTAYDAGVCGTPHRAGAAQPPRLDLP